MRKYIGITVGPIFDTISDATTPSALWFASRMFSDITRRICKAILYGYKDVNVKLYSPYYSDEITMDDGVGKFHDRVIFSIESDNVGDLDGIISNVKRETINGFSKEVLNGEKSEQFIMDYLQIHYVVLDESELNDKNCVLVISPYLDALELMKSFPSNDENNPIGKLFAGEHEAKNTYVKNSPLFCDKYEQLCKNGNIRSIEDIAGKNNGTKHKCNNYYVVVSADGDGMGAFLETISNDEVTIFSKKCLEYDECATAMIGELGGMTIYAGGDDLLFLAPIVNGGKDVFTLCKEISEKFSEKIAECEEFKGKQILTVSFGISIQYYKYPLYEALKKSRELLYTAKSVNAKNNMAINLQKHSGQSIEVVINNDDCSVIDHIIKCSNDRSEGNESAEMLHSILYTLNNFKALFNTLDNSFIAKNINEDQYKLAWNNFFDNVNQKEWKPYIDTLCEIYIQEILSKKEKYNDPLQSFCYLLKLKHFIEEKEGN